MDVAIITPEKINTEDAADRIPKLCKYNGKVLECSCERTKKNGDPWYCYPRTVTKVGSQFRFRMFWSCRKAKNDPLNCGILE